MSCAILAHEQKALEAIFEIVKRAYTNIPEALRPTTKTDTKRMYQFVSRYDGAPLDSSIYVSLKIRSGTVQKLHVTEIAFIKDIAELKAGSKQAVPKTGTISEETTGNGFNEFFDDFTEADQNPNPTDYDYKTYFYAWYENPEYTLPGELPQEEKTPAELELQRLYPITDGQLLWRRWKIKELMRKQEGVGLNGDQLFKQEYPTTKSEAFQSGSGNIFDAVKIDAISPPDPLTIEQGEAIIKGPDFDVIGEWDKALRLQRIEQFKQFVARGVKFWRLPLPDMAYTIGCDPADGAGSDNTDVDIWDDNLVQCAQYYGKLRPDDTAELIADLGNFYNHAFAGVENNMLTTVLLLSKVYDYYYYETVQDEKTNKKTKKLGWRTSTKTRDPLIDEYVIAFDDGDLTINSRVTLSEMRTFVKKPDTGKREHADGKHDDALFGAMIAIRIRALRPRGGRVFTGNPL